MSRELVVCTDAGAAGRISADAGKRRERLANADVAQLAERVLGKDEVTGSIPVIGSTSMLPARD